MRYEKNKFKIKNNLYILLAIFLFFIIILYPLVIKSQMWIDEILDSEPAYNLAFRGRLTLDALGGICGTDKAFFLRPPVYSLILSYLYNLFGFKRTVTLSLSFIPAILSFCLTYILSFLLFKNMAISILGSFFFGLSPLGIYIAKAGRADALALFLYSFSLLIFFIYMISKRRYIRNILLIFTGIFFSLSVQTYQLYAFLLISFFYYFFIELRSKDTFWFKDMSIFLFSFLIPFILWLSFILKDFYNFKNQILYNFFIATNFDRFNIVNFFPFNIKIILSDQSYFILLFILISVLFIIKRYPQYKNIFIGFVVLPSIILFLFNLFKGHYIQIILPLGFVAGGFFINHLYRLGLVRNDYLLRFILYFFFLFYFFYGLGIRYFLTIKDWKKRYLVGYEMEIKRFIPKNSIVLGNPEDWYAVLASGSRLLLFEATRLPYFDWSKLDYIIIPLYIDISKEYPEISHFVRKNCKPIAVIGKGAYSYKLLDNCNRFSGYNSIIYKVNK